jgi:hypothetical protein
MPFPGEYLRDYAACIRATGSGAATTEATRGFHHDTGEGGVSESCVGASISNTTLPTLVAGSDPCRSSMNIRANRWQITPRCPAPALTLLPSLTGSRHGVAIRRFCAATTALNHQVV